MRRQIAGKLLQEGKGIREIARLVEVSPGSVFRWKTALEAGGKDALKAKPHPVRACRLSAEQKQDLVETLRKGPLAAGFPTDLWTLPRVTEVIERQFGVKYHPGHVWYILRELNWSSQKPEKRARERDEEAIRNWREQDWERIKKKSAKTA